MTFVVLVVILLLLLTLGDWYLALPVSSFGIDIVICLTTAIIIAIGACWYRICIALLGSCICYDVSYCCNCNGDNISVGSAVALLLYWCR